MEEKLQKVFGTSSPEYITQLKNDLKILTDHGLSAEHDLPTLASNTSLAGDIRAKACWFLARLADKRASTPVLLRLLRDASPDVRMEAARSVGLIQSKRALPILIQMAKSDADVDVRILAVHGLGLLGDPRALGALVSILQDTRESPAMRGEAVEQIANIGVSHSELLRLLESFLQNEPEEVTFWTAYALGEIGDPTVMPALKRVVDTDFRVLEPHGSVSNEASEAIEAILRRQERGR